MLTVYFCYRKGVDGSTIPSFSRCLEHFYSLCDQLECQLNLAYQQLSQGLSSAQFVQSLATVNFKSDVKGSQVHVLLCHLMFYWLLYFAVVLSSFVFAFVLSFFFARKRCIWDEFIIVFKLSL